MNPKTVGTAQSTARAKKADQAREGARAMQEYMARRAQAVAKMARLRALRIAHEDALDQQKKARKG